MANAIILPATASQNQQSLLLQDPRFPRANRLQFGREEETQLRLANTFFVPAGLYPARGWFLLSRADLNKLTNLFRTDLQLALADSLGNTLLFQNLALVQARCVTRGLASDPTALYLAELTDRRGVVYNPWSQNPLLNQFNVAAPAYPGGLYALSTQTGVPYTWATMLQTIWGVMAATLGPWPGLPIAPSGTPADFIYPGVPAWKSFCHVLDLLGLTVAVDLTQANPYAIVARGASDLNFANQQIQFAGQVEDDYEWVDFGAGRVPGSVTVYFHRANQYYGTEETVRGDALQWSSTPNYAITVPAPAAFAGAPGQDSFWDDFVVRFDVDGNPLAADVAQATAIAAERVSQYYNRISWASQGFLHRVYAGALPFRAGSLVDGVRWFMELRQGRWAWRTEIVRGPEPPWPEVAIIE